MIHVRPQDPRKIRHVDLASPTTEKIVDDCLRAVEFLLQLVKNKGARGLGTQRQGILPWRSLISLVAACHACVIFSVIGGWLN